MNITKLFNILPGSSDTRRLSRFESIFSSDLYLQQSPDLQSTFWVLCPTQSRPSFEGGGLSQDLTRILTPTPQDLVQALQDDHSPQFPSTKNETKKQVNDFIVNSPYQKLRDGIYTQNVSSTSLSRNLVRTGRI